MVTNRGKGKLGREGGSSEGWERGFFLVSMLSYLVYVCFLWVGSWKIVVTGGFVKEKGGEVFRVWCPFSRGKGSAFFLCYGNVLCLMRVFCVDGARS